MRSSTGHPQGSSGQPSALSELLTDFVAQRGWRERLRDSEVHTYWTDIVGPELSAHVAPVRLRGGVLVLRAASGAWATQLRYLSPWLLQRVQEVLGSERVVRIQIVTGAQDPTGSASDDA